MSNISTVYDAMITRIETLLPTYKRLTNPYKISENNERFLDIGYAVALGPATRGTGYVNSKVRVHRDFTVSLTRKYYAKETDVAAKATTEKQLFEDQILLIKDFEKDPTINSSGANLVAYESDGGIEHVFSNKDQYLLLRSTFTVDYLETIT